MAAYYTILGKKVPPHVLSLLTLGSVVGYVAWPKAKAPEAPATTAATPAPVAAPASKEEDFDLEKFINDLSKEETK